MEEGRGLYLGCVLDVVLGEIHCSGFLENEDWGRQPTALHCCGTVDGVRAHAFMNKEWEPGSVGPRLKPLLQRKHNERSLVVQRHAHVPPSVGRDLKLLFRTV